MKKEGNGKRWIKHLALFFDTFNLVERQMTETIQSGWK